MTARAGAVLAPEKAGIPARPGVARTDLTPPPGERGAPPEGAAPRVTPASTRGRAIIPLSNGGPVMEDAIPRRHAWHVDAINSAPDAETALYRMMQWTRAELAKCAKSRPEDADGFRSQLIHLMAPVVAVIYKSHPLPEYRVMPKLPGGGWTPRKPEVRAAEARPPGGRR